MTTSATISVSYADGKTLDELSRLIAARERVLKEDTTEKADRATAINVLTSLRVQTGIAPKKNPVVFEPRWHVRIEVAGYVSSWMKGGHRAVRNPGTRTYTIKGKTITRYDGTHGAKREIGGRRVVNLAGNFAMGPNPAVFRLRIYSLPTPSKPWYDAHCIANSEDDVRKFARRRILRRIGQYRGISKRVLGLCAHKVSGKQSPGSPCGKGEDIAQAAAKVMTSGSGFSSGSFGITVEDALPFAMRALKDGQASLNLALSNAAARTRAIIEKAGGKSLLEKMNLDFGPDNP